MTDKKFVPLKMIEFTLVIVTPMQLSNRLYGSSEALAEKGRVQAEAIAHVACGAHDLRHSKGSFAEEVAAFGFDCAMNGAFVRFFVIDSYDSEDERIISEVVRRYYERLNCSLDIEATLRADSDHIHGRAIWKLIGKVQTEPTST